MLHPGYDRARMPAYTAKQYQEGKSVLYGKRKIASPDIVVLLRNGAHIDIRSQILSATRARGDNVRVYRIDIAGRQERDRRGCAHQS